MSTPLRITVTAVGQIGAGKTTAIMAMVIALQNDPRFRILTESKEIHHFLNSETCTIEVVMA